MTQADKAAGVLGSPAVEESAFDRLQREHHARADADHFRWQTAAPWFAATEAGLLDEVELAPGERLCEIGCGEGGNLYHLRARGLPGRLFGVDYSPAKAAFARRATGAAIACADATRLPFGDRAFDALLIRDLLHHLPDRAAALAEAHRVLAPGGRLMLFEPNRRSPLVRLQAALVPAERGLSASSAERLSGELEHAGFAIVRFAVRQPFPIGRVLLHPLLRTAELGAWSPVRAALEGVEFLARRLVPERAWLYLTFHCVKT